MYNFFLWCYDDVIMHCSSSPSVTTKKFFSPKELDCVQSDGEYEQCMMMSSWCHKKTFFCCLGIFGIITYLLNLLKKGRNKKEAGSGGSSATKIEGP